MLKLVLTHDVKPEQVRAIRLRAGSNILNPLRYPIAHTELEAKFCPAFMMSSLVLRRKAGIHEFTDEFVQSAPVQDMMKKVDDRARPGDRGARLRQDAQHRRSGPRRTAGRWCRKPTSGTAAGPEKPVHTRGAAREVHRLREPRAAPEAIAETLERLESLEQVRNVRELVGVLTSGVLGAQAAARRREPASLNAYIQNSRHSRRRHRNGSDPRRSSRARRGGGSSASPSSSPISTGAARRYKKTGRLMPEDGSIS